jgi:hypothetical protein
VTFTKLLTVYQKHMFIPNADFAVGPETLLAAVLRDPAFQDPSVLCHLHLIMHFHG